MVSSAKVVLEIIIDRIPEIKSKLEPLLEYNCKRIALYSNKQVKVYCKKAAVHLTLKK